jgi:hypothetical protein
LIDEVARRRTEVEAARATSTTSHQHVDAWRFLRQILGRLAARKASPTFTWGWRERLVHVLQERLCRRSQAGADIGDLRRPAPTCCCWAGVDGREAVSSLFRFDFRLLAENEAEVPFEKASARKSWRSIRTGMTASGTSEAS